MNERHEKDVSSPVAPAHTRRGFIRTAIAGALGFVGGALVHEDSAKAADGTLLAAGERTTATGKTELATDGSIVGDGALVVTAPNADYGLKAAAKSIGVYGSAPIGVYGDGSVGGVFSGSDASLSLIPRSASGPPTGSNLKGDIALDADAVLWLCVADGSPGTWIALSGGGIRPLDAPQRVFDSRAAASFRPDDIRTVDATQTVDGKPSGVPAGAKAVAANLTVTNTYSNGYLTAYPSGTAKPPTSNVNWSQGQTIANSAIVGVVAGKLALYVNNSVADVIVDVSGYVL